ncbi:hypothetical protein SCLCIDRAFT_434508 [Scleroderma citrinum Foug A]|uniref:Uncharacterized protein n=1 Tax=Scleroderma citrinum Foug A TaxID=1036808 RepID=A0A0C2YV48_9AGAM|nr:hypothetical protein SCLCIDRAFT_434508 [Scleroderma citrinum Foug A]
MGLFSLGVWRVDPHGSWEYTADCGRIYMVDAGVAFHSSFNVSPISVIPHMQRRINQISAQWRCCPSLP